MLVIEIEITTYLSIKLNIIKYNRYLCHILLRTHK